MANTEIPFLPGKSSWRVSRTAHAGFILDALEQALHKRRPVGSLILQSDRGSRYVSIKFTERLAEAGIELSVGGVGVSRDSVLAETIDGPWLRTLNQMASGNPGAAQYCCNRQAIIRFKVDTPKTP